MEDILLDINPDQDLRLKFFDAVHPSLVDMRAEDWKFIFQLYQKKSKIDNGFFTSNFFISKPEKLLFIEEYHSSITNKGYIKTDSDVLTNLRIFDFKNNTTGNFSKLTGGSFLMLKIVDTIFYFNKQYPGVTSEFEIDITKIKYEAISDAQATSPIMSALRSIFRLRKAI